jgi:hypothetical protein
MRAFFIELHKAAVTTDIAGHDSSETARRHSAARRHIISGGINIANFIAHALNSTPPATALFWCQSEPIRLLKILIERVQRAEIQSISTP